jgi:acetolactate synthase-1/3 small subunit
VDVSAESVSIEVTGDKEKVDSLYKLLRSFGIKEIARTGVIAMTRGEGSTSMIGTAQPTTRTKNKKTR